MQMSYLQKIEYEIIPQESLLVIRNCSGCGKKSYFKNTERFRVNANGNKVDVWLIYQCEKCKHTFNLTIYERRKVSSLPEKEYKRFLSNDKQLAEMYGRDYQLFKRNKVEVDFDNMNYWFKKLKEKTETNNCRQEILIIVHNPYELKIRPERQVAEILGLSRSNVKKLMKQEEIKIKKSSAQSISVSVNPYLFSCGGQSNENRNETFNHNNI